MSAESAFTIFIAIRSSARAARRFTIRWRRSGRAAAARRRFPAAPAAKVAVEKEPDETAQGEEAEEEVVEVEDDADIDTDDDDDMIDGDDDIPGVIADEEG